MMQFGSHDQGNPRASVKTIGVAIQIAALLAPFSLAVGCKASSPPALRIAGDGWFLKSLVNTGMIAGFERQTGIRVEVLDRSDATIASDLDRGPRPGEPAYDVVVLRHSLLGALIQKKEIRAIDGMMAAPSLRNQGFSPQQQLFPNWFEELSTFGNKVYGYPYTGLTAYLCYRKDLLGDLQNRRRFKARYHRDLGPPSNWHEFMQVAEFFNRPRDRFYGAFISGKRGPALWYEWLNFVYSFGGNILDTKRGWEYGDIVVNSPANVAATQQYLRLIPLSPPDTLTYGWDQAQMALQQGRVFMGLLWSDQAHFLEDPRVSKVAGRIGYSLIPTDTGQPFSQLAGLTYLLPRESREPEEAYRFIAWAMSEPVQIQQTLQGSESIRKSTYQDSSVMRLPYTPTFLAGAPVAREKPTIPEASQMRDAAELRLSEIVDGKESAQSGLDKLALDLKTILGSKARLRYPAPAGPE